MFASAVNASGRVFTASHWDEAHRESGIYENGDVIGNCPKSIGEAVAVNNSRAFVGAGRGVRQFDFNGSETGKFYALTNAPRALAANSTLLFVSDAVENRVLAIDIETGTQRASWNVSQPGALAAGTRGDLWVVANIQRQAWDGRYWMIDSANPAKILHFSGNGEKLPGEFSGESNDWKPTALAFDSLGRLMIGDDGPRHQVLFCEVSPAPRVVSTFGARGGIGSGAPGVAEPDKFWGITGIGADTDGNIYVTLNEQGCALRKFSTNGKLGWELANHIFVDVADFDPASGGRDIYAKQEHFVFDYTKPPGQGWRLQSHTLDATRFPEDPRLWMANDGHALVSPFIRRLNGGRLYMYLCGMSSPTLAIYRFEGEMAAPAGLISKTHYRSKGAPNYPPFQPPGGEWIWRDENGDGKFASREFEQHAISATRSSATRSDLDFQDPDFDGSFSAADLAPATIVHGEGDRWNWFVDARGDIWTDSTEGLRRFQLVGFDGFQNPIYHFDQAERIPAPVPFNRVSRIHYEPATDTMFLSGYTEALPYHAKFWKEAGRVLARYDHWSEGNRKPRWAETWHWQEGGRESFATPHCFSVAGDYIHVGFFHRGGPVVNRVYNARTGALAGEIRPGPEINRVIGDIDVVSGIRAFQKADGEQIILQEDDRYGKIVMFRWKPDAEKSIKETKQ